MGGSYYKCKGMYVFVTGSGDGGWREELGKMVQGGEYADHSISSGRVTAILETHLILAPLI